MSDVTFRELIAESERQRHRLRKELEQVRGERRVKVKEHLNLLGFRVRDRVSGIEGIVDALSFDLYGCIQASLNAGFRKDGEKKPSYWFDVSRLEILDQTPILARPDFVEGPIADGRHGPAHKDPR